MIRSSLTKNLFIRYGSAWIPFAKLKGEPFYQEAIGWGPHWTPEGQKVGAGRILGLLSVNHIVHSDAAAEKLAAAQLKAQFAAERAKVAET